jgi:hypothetical protein
MIDQTIFCAGGRAYTREQVLSAADFRGSLEPIRNTIRSGLACRRYAEEEGFELDADELQSVAEDYRYQNDLTTAEETESWLATHSLTLDDLSAYLERRFWLHRFSSQIEVILAEYHPRPDEAEALTWQEVSFGNHFPLLARALAARVAARIEEGKAQAYLPWDDELAEMEAIYRGHCRRRLTPERLQRELTDRKMSLVRFELESARVPALSIAREIFLCVIRDGEELREVSSRAAGRYESFTLFLEDLPAEAQPKVFSAAPGETLPPFQDASAFRVIRVCRKIDPDLTDPVVRERVEQAVIASVCAELEQKHIMWSGHAGLIR